MPSYVFLATVNKTHVCKSDVSPHEVPEIPTQTEELASQLHLPQSFEAFENPAYHDMTIESTSEKHVRSMSHSMDALKAS